MLSQPIPSSAAQCCQDTTHAWSPVDECYSRATNKHYPYGMSLKCALLTRPETLRSSPKKPHGWDRHCKWFKFWCFQLHPNDISRPSRHNHLEMTHWHQNSDLHAGREAHYSKSRQVVHIARIHLLNIDIQIVIPTQGGNRIFATNLKTAPPHVTSVINKIKQIN